MLQTKQLFFKKIIYVRNNQFTITVDKSLHYTIIILLVLLPYILVTMLYYFIYIRQNQYFVIYLKLSFLLFAIVYFVPIGIYAYEFDKLINKLKLKTYNTNIDTNIIRKITIRYLYANTISNILTITLFLMYFFIIIPGMHILIKGYTLNLLIMGIYVLYYVGASIVAGIYERQLVILIKDND